MRDKNIIVLKKVLKYCNHIEESRNRFGDSYQAFVSDFSYQNDCSMSILQIGELCKALSMDFRALHSDVPWKDWCGIRDIMAHKYEEIDLEIVWGTITDDIPLLKDHIEKILPSGSEQNQQPPGRSSRWQT